MTRAWQSNSTAQHSTAQHSTAQHSTAQHSAAQRSAAHRNTAQRSTAQRSTAQRSAAQHSTRHTARHPNFPAESAQYANLSSTPSQTANQVQLKLGSRQRTKYLIHDDSSFSGICYTHMYAGLSPLGQAPTWGAQTEWIAWTLSMDKLHLS